MDCASTSEVDQRRVHSNCVLEPSTVDGSTDVAATNSAIVTVLIYLGAEVKMGGPPPGPAERKVKADIAELKKKLGKSSVKRHGNREYKAAQGLSGLRHHRGLQGTGVSRQGWSTCNRPLVAPMQCPMQMRHRPRTWLGKATMYRTCTHRGEEGEPDHVHPLSLNECLYVQSFCNIILLRGSICREFLHHCLTCVWCLRCARESVAYRSPMHGSPMPHCVASHPRCGCVAASLCGFLRREMEQACRNTEGT